MYIYFWKNLNQPVNEQKNKPIKEIKQNHKKIREGRKKKKKPTKNT